MQIETLMEHGKHHQFIRLKRKQTIQQLNTPKKEKEAVFLDNPKNNLIFFIL